MKPALSVETHGAIRLSHVVQVVDRPDAKVWSVDCHSKYATVYEAYGDGDVEIMLVATKETLRADESKRTLPTILKFSFPKGENWHVLTQGGRYEFTIVAFRWSAKDGDLKLTWEEAS